ncbi:TPA: hypothetical protein L4U50_003482 [Pseudomonas aeruginosa]|nr:hypothetical protein [Pseudomonas aeruginosa]
MSEKIDMEFARRDDCLERMVPSDLRLLISERDKAEADAQALKEENFRLREERDSQQRLNIKAMEEVAALKHSQQVLIGSRNAHRDERDAARKEVETLRARVVMPDASTVYAALDARERLFTSPENIQVALEAQSRLNGLTVSESALETLRRSATGKVMHLNNGLCPDAFEGHEARDPDCPVCRALIETGKESNNV